MVWANVPSYGINGDFNFGLGFFRVFDDYHRFAQLDFRP
jgi:hypothetical protein